MERRLRIQVWVETALAVIGVGLALLSMIWPQWIEGIIGVEPDGGSGELEWVIAAGFLVAGFVFGLLARRGQRRLRRLATT